MRKFYTFFVTVFWFIMIGLLFQKEVLPNLIITNPVGYKIELTKDYPVRESWMGIYFKDKKIGFSNTVISQDVDDGVAGYRINEATLLRLSILGEERFVRMNGSSFFIENHTLKKFKYKLVVGEYKLEVHGRFEGDSLNLTMDVGGEKKKKVIKIKQDILISNSISPILLFKKFNLNKEINFEIFDPVTFGINRVSVKNVGTESIELDGISYDAYVFETDFSGIKTKTWMTEDGDILKEESVLGFTMYKENPKDALDAVHSLSFDVQDLASEFSIYSNVEILNPRDISYLKINKNNVVIEIAKDAIPIKQDVLLIPIDDDIPEDDFVNSGDQRILKLAMDIIGEEKDSWIASRKILHWVYDNVKKIPTLSVPSSLDVLRTMHGDCNEHTVLFTALTRSAGIPTKMIAGVVYLDGSFYYHAWPRVYVGQWVSMDPTLGQEIADATHIPILEGGLREQLELVGIIKDLEIEVIEYK